MEELGDIDIDFNLDEDIQVNIITTPENKINNTNNPLEPLKSNLDQVFISNTKSNNLTKFVLDTAATKHIICNKSYFTDFRECSKLVNWGSAKSIIIKGIGNVYIKFKDFNKSFLLKNCLYMPELGINLISQSELNSEYYSIFTKDKIYLKNNNNITITKGNKINGLYYLDIIPNNKEKIFTLIDAFKNNKSHLGYPKEIVNNKSQLSYPDNLIVNNKSQLGYPKQNNIIINNKNINKNQKQLNNNKILNKDLNSYKKHNKVLNKDLNKIKNNITKFDLHKRLGHLSLNYLNKVINNTEGYENIISNKIINKQILECEICLKSKFTNKINKLSNTKEFDLLEKITSDLCGPISPPTYNKYRYFITFLDKKSRFLEIELLKTKDEAYNAFIKFKSREENNKNNKRIRIYATDNRTEFINNKFKDYLINHGIIH
jgi:hypothetical protein